MLQSNHEAIVPSDRLHSMSNVTENVSSSACPSSDDIVDNASCGPSPLYSPDQVTTIGSTEVDRLIWAYASPPIFILGIVGNLLTILVTGRHQTRRTSSGVYLITMSLGAIGVYLVGFLSQWLRACHFVDLTELGVWWCRFNKFFYYSSGDVAIWTLTLLTFDRLIAVCFPLHKIKFCTRRRAVTLCCVVAALAVAKNLHMFWTRGTVYHPSGEVKSHCGAPAPYTYFETYVRPWIVFTVVTLLPVVVILVCNILVIRVLARSRNIRSSVGGGRTGNNQKKRRSRMTTMMCLAASFSFIVFTAPSIILVVLRPYYSGASYDIAKAVNNLLVHVNYAANFFLYCLGGRSFRLRLKLMLLSLFCRSRSNRLQLQPFFSRAPQQAKPNAEFLMADKPSMSSSTATSSIRQ